METYLKQAGIVSSVYSDITPDPTVETVVSGAEAMKKFGPDLIIALGGGSPIDAANNFAFPEIIIHTCPNITNGSTEKPNTKEDQRCQKEK